MQGGGNTNLGSVLKKGCFWDSFTYGGGVGDVDFSMLFHNRSARPLWNW